MKNFILHPSSFILSTLLFAFGCTGQRMLTLPDGTKLAPSPTYLSAKEMAAKGKNSYGVPETSFAFYSENYAPSELSAGGLDKKNGQI